MGTLLVDLPYVAAVAMWAVSIARCTMIRGRDTRLAWLAMASLAAAQLLQVEAGYRAFEAATGVVGSAAVVKHTLALLSAACVATAGIEALAPADTTVTWRTRRATWTALALATAISVAPWIIDRPHQLGPALAHRSEYFDPTWRSAVHWGAYLAYLGWALATSARACWRFRAATPSSAPRTALTLVGIGTALSLTYIAEKAIIVALWIGHDGAGTVLADQVAETIIVLVALPLIALGCAYEPLADVVAELRRRREYRHAARQLAPFAQRTTREFPHIGTSLARAADEHVIAATAAIHEALRQLTAYVPCPEFGVAPADQLRHQARWLSDALAVKGAGKPPTFGVTAAPIGDAGRSLDSARTLAALYAQAQLTDVGARASLITAGTKG